MAHQHRSRFTARPTVYKGIQMRSRLEATYAAFLDSMGGGLCWAYEPRCFADATGQYLPDFHEWMAGGPESEPDSGTYVEVKPFAPPGASTEALQARMQIIWSSHPTAHLSIWTPGERWSACPPTGEGHSMLKGWIYFGADEDEIWSCSE